MTGQPSQSVKPIPILTDCCQRQASCRLHLLHKGRVIDSTFVSLQPGCITVAFTNTSRDDSPPTGSLCCVTFPYRQSLHAFLAGVQIAISDGTATEVQLDLPASLSVTNLRRTYRVPVVRESGVELIVHLPDGRRIPSEILNLSEAGAEVTLPADDIPLPVDTEIRCDLKFRDDTLEVPAIVRRRQQAHCGFQFALIRVPESRRAIATLQRMVRSLEQVWLKNRLA
jgi:hypothetical protein